MSCAHFKLQSFVVRGVGLRIGKVVLSYHDTVMNGLLVEAECEDVWSRSEMQLHYILQGEMVGEERVKCHARGALITPEELSGSNSTA